MDIIDVLDNQEFNELVNCDFEEVRKLFNFCAYYVADKDEKRFVAEATQVKADYLEELKRIDDYKTGEYCKLVQARRPGFEEEPAYMEEVLSAKTRDLLIGLIEKYFDEATYQEHRHELINKVSTKRDDEKPIELGLNLLIEKRYIYAFLSTIGYWQRHRGYFLSNRGFWAICSKYSSEVVKVNPALKSINNGFFNIFLGDCRIDSDDYIDIDEISYIKLITPYLQTNTAQLIEIVKIITKCFRQRDAVDRWLNAQEEIDSYIAKCESEGLMKKAL